MHNSLMLADPDAKLPFGVRLRQFGWRYGSFVLLGLGTLAPAFMLIEGGGWPFAAAWLAVHAILACSVHAQNHQLPRFHPPGLGKPSDPGVLEPGTKLEHPPVRSKWELFVFLLAGWMILGLGASLPKVPIWIPAAYVALVGLASALLVYAYDRGSATELRRLLGAGEDCVVGTVVVEPKDREQDRDRPWMWREVQLYVWSESRQVQKSITDSEGRSQTVQTTQTTHYSCGMRREQIPPNLVLDTPQGPVEVKLSGCVWASERALMFGRRAGKGHAWRKGKGGLASDRCQGAALEQINAGDRVAVVGKLRRGNDQRGRVGRSEEGPVVLFACAQRDPLRVLRQALLRRRALISCMVWSAALALVAVAMSLIP